MAKWIVGVVLALFVGFFYLVAMDQYYIAKQGAVVELNSFTIHNLLFWAVMLGSFGVGFWFTNRLTNRRVRRH